MLAAHNDSRYGLNGAQAIFELPQDVKFLDSPDGIATQIGRTIVVTIGRLEAGTTATVQIHVLVDALAEHGDDLRARGGLRSSTALTVRSEEVSTRISDGPGDDN